MSSVSLVLLRGSLVGSSLTQVWLAVVEGSTAALTALSTSPSVICREGLHGAQKLLFVMTKNGKLHAESNKHLL